MKKAAVRGFYGCSLASGLNRQTIHHGGNLPGMIGPVIVIPAYRLKRGVTAEGSRLPVVAAEAIEPGRNRFRNATKTDDLLAFDIAYLKRTKKFHPGARESLTWSRCGRPMA
jgi:hypothetical protein